MVCCWTRRVFSSVPVTLAHNAYMFLIGGRHDTRAHSFRVRRSGLLVDCPSVGCGCLQSCTFIRCCEGDCRNERRTETSVSAQLGAFADWVSDIFGRLREATQSRAIHLLAWHNRYHFV